MPSVSELAAQLNEEARETLLRTVQAMPEDKHGWQPLEVGRSVLHQIVECGGLNQFVGHILRSRTVPPLEPGQLRETLEKLYAEHDTLPKAVEYLKKGTEGLINAIQEFPAEHLDDSVTMPSGQGKTFAELMLYPYWNMSYHHGQINYIQTLYGDREHR